jgi:hypothetical protein
MGAVGFNAWTIFLAAMTALLVFGLFAEPYKTALLVVWVLGLAAAFFLGEKLTKKPT